MSSGPVGVAIVGAGVISGQYLNSLATFPDVAVLGIADLDVGRAKDQAEKHNVPVAGDVDTILGIPEVEIVVNLTVPAAHTEVARAALRAGKHAYGEKPLAMDVDDGAKLLAEAEELGLRVGCAPDTFLGAGFQSAYRAFAAGTIGAPVSAMTAIMLPGPESWHPSPEFLFATGGGPVMDVGPYYLTSLVAMLGPVRRVVSVARQGRSERLIGSGPKQGMTFPVEVPTHVVSLLEFADGPSATSTFSFDSAKRNIMFEVTGVEGTLAVPNPNNFAGDVLLMKRGDKEWTELPVEGDTTGRGLGVLDMARAIQADVPHRASGELAQHVLELMSVIESAPTSLTPITSSVTRPQPLPMDWNPHVATL